MSKKEQTPNTPSRPDVIKSRNWALLAFLVVFVVIFYGLGLLRIKTG